MRFETPARHSHSPRVSRCWKTDDLRLPKPVLHTNPRSLRRHWAGWRRWLCETTTLQSTTHRCGESVTSLLSWFSRILFPTHLLLEVWCVRILWDYALSFLRIGSTNLRACRGAFQTIFVQFLDRGITNVLSVICASASTSLNFETHFFEVSLSRPIDVIVHRHEDDSIFEFLSSDSVLCHLFF